MYVSDNYEGMVSWDKSANWKNYRELLIAGISNRK